MAQVPATDDRRLILGREIAADVELQAAPRLAELRSAGIAPALAVVCRGDHDDAASYRRMIGQRAKRLGVPISLVQLRDDATLNELTEAVDRLNRDRSIHAILVQNPLPASMRLAVSHMLAPEKDVEGLHACNLGRLSLNEPVVTPCTAGAILALIRSRVPSLAGKRVTVVNRSPTVGRPLAQLLLNEHATVTICSSATVDLAAETRRAEILVVAIGRARAIDAEYIGDGAVVIDVGINPDPGGDGICGDVDTESALTRAAAITPVPGGVGPVTTAVLITNVVHLAHLQQITGVQER